MIKKNIEFKKRDCNNIDIVFNGIIMDKVNISDDNSFSNSVQDYYLVEDTDKKIHIVSPNNISKIID